MNKQRYEALMQKAFNWVFGPLILVLVFTLMYQIGLFYGAIISFSIAALFLGGFLLWWIDCKGKSGCISGIILMPVPIFFVLGVILISLDFYFKM